MPSQSKYLFINQVTFVDFKNKKKSREMIMNSDKTEEIQEKQKLAGLEDKFPIENFVILKSEQKNQDISLQTYKYPSNSQEIKGVIYLL